MTLYFLGVILAFFGLCVLIGILAIRVSSLESRMRKLFNELYLRECEDMKLRANEIHS